MFLCLAILVEHRLVTDAPTHGHALAVKTNQLALAVVDQSQRRNVITSIRLFPLLTFEQSAL